MRQSRFTYLFKKFDSWGSLYILWPGGELRAKLNKIGSRIQFTMLPLIQLHLRWTLSFPVKLIGLSFFYDPAFSWSKPHGYH